MADTNDAFRAGFEAFNEEGNYCNPYLSYHKHNAFIHGWNEARRAKREQQRTFFRAGPPSMLFSYFIVELETNRAIAGFCTSRDAYGYMEMCVRSTAFAVSDASGRVVDRDGEIV